MMDIIDGEYTNKLQLLTAYLTIFPSCKLDAQGIAMYTMLLSDVSLDELKIAMLKISNENKFYPTIAEIKEKIKSIHEILNPDQHIKTADEAWREVLQQMRLAFPYKSPEFSTEEIQDAVRTLGWMVICETSSDKMGITRAQFRDIYNNIIRRKEEREENLKIISAMPKRLENSTLKKLLLPEREFTDATRNKGV